MIRAIIFDYYGVVRRSDGTHDPAVLEVILQLRANYKVALLSNIGRGGLQRFWTPEELRMYFDDAVASGDVGMVKPDPDLFSLMAERLGVRLDECLLIDDQDSYCAAAKILGMQTIYYQNFDQFKRELDALLSQSGI